MIFRARIECYIAHDSDPTTLCFTNGKGHYDASGNFYEPRLMTSFNMERHVFGDGTTAGASDVALGTMEIENLDGALDAYKNYGFDGRSVILEAAPTEDGTFRTIWTGQASYAQFEWERVLVYLRDRQEQLYTRKVQETLYEGEDEEIEGTPVPQCYGRCLNMPLTLIDPSLLLYQGGESFYSVEAVYDSGVALGSSLILNGGFDSDEHWIDAYTNDIFDGKLNINYVMNPGSLVEQEITSIHIGDEYSFSMDVDSISLSAPPGYTPILGVQFVIKYDKTSVHYVTIYSDTVGITGMVSGTFIATLPASYTNIKGMFIRVVTSGFGSAVCDNISISAHIEDHATRAELEAATIPHGGYHTCLAEGLIRLGSTPNGTVTADVRGSNPATVPAIVQTLLLGKADLTEADLDLPAFAALANPETGNDSEAGIYLTGDETFQEALDMLFGSVGAWYGFDRSQNKLTCARVELPTTADLALNMETETLASGGVARKRTRDQGDGIPAWRVRLKHSRNWTVQDDGLVTDATYVANNLAGSVSEARRIWLAKDYREAVAENTDVRGLHPLSSEMEFETLLLENAAVEASRRLDLYSGARERYELTVPMELLFDPDSGMRVDLGGAVEITSDRFGLSAGKTFLVIGMTEIYAGDVDEVTLDLFG